MHSALAPSPFEVVQRACLGDRLGRERAANSFVRIESRDPHAAAR
jgi:hypothetical protein